MISAPGARGLTVHLPLVLEETQEAVTCAARELAKQADIPFPLMLPKQFLAGPLTFLKCVADCTFRTGCMRESRTMMLMSAPE